MLNNSQINSVALNSQKASVADANSAVDDLVFNGMSLQNANIVTTALKDSSTPSREIVTFKIPRNDGRGYIADYFRDRRIKVTGYITTASVAAMETLIDQMKRRLTKREGVFSRNINGQVRTIKATLDNPDQMFAKREGYHITFCPFELEFMSLEPMWHDAEYISNSNFGVTNLNFSESIENLGTYKVPAVVVILVEADSAVTALEFKNNTNGDDIKVTTPLVTGDILVIDGENKQVTKNGVVIDYDGIFPDIEYGTNSYSLITTAASIQYTVTMKIKQAYL